MNIELKVESIKIEVVDAETVGVDVFLRFGDVEVNYELCAVINPDDRSIEEIIPSEGLGSSPLDKVVIAALINADTGIDLIESINSRYSHYLETEHLRD